jgi:hypothetical protein
MDNNTYLVVGNATNQIPLISNIEELNIIQQPAEIEEIVENIEEDYLVIDNNIISDENELEESLTVEDLEDTTSVMHEEKAVLEWELRKALIAESESKDADYVTKTGVTLKNAGKNGFGTYSQLIKDLRLPTAAHTGWNSVQKDEMPVVGATYDQYIITYYAPSTANPSFTAVGNRSMSETTHVFWVKSDLVTEWEGILSTIDPDGGKLNDTKSAPAAVKPAKENYVNKKADSVLG